MKQIKSITLSLLLLLFMGWCAQVSATFDGSNLYMSVYNNTTTTGDVEFGFDTGLSLDAFDWTQPFTHTIQTTLSDAMFAGTWADLRVAFFTYDRLSATTGFGYSYAASTDTNNAVNGTVYNSFRAEAENVRNAYNAADTDGDGVALMPSNLSGNTYDMRMNGGGTSPGQYNGFNPTPEDGEVSLGVFGDADSNNDTITMYLFGYLRTGAAPTTGTYMTNSITGDAYLATITLSADGTLTISNPGPSACPDGDADADGVCDDADDCPNTPADAEVDENGCAASQRDSDGDGVFDSVDQCSGTPAGTAVDSVGCPLPIDSDGDGVPDIQDQCPGIPDVHSDDDGVANCIDTNDDNDGLPDNCDRTEWGLNPLVANASDGDLDNDGFSDPQECQSGFNPNSDASQPVRPTVTAADSDAAASGDRVTLTATASPGSNPIAAFTWTQTQGPAVSVTQTDTIPTSTITFMAPAVAAGQTATLGFTVTATDSVGIAASPAAQAAVEVTSIGNNTPGSPGLHAPAIDPEVDCQVETVTPELVVNNAADIDEDDLTLEIEVARDAAFTDIIAIVADIAQTPGNTTAWTYEGPALDEDTLYYWRARACDADACSANMDPVGFFFVNAENTPPIAPVLDSPADGAMVGSLRPAFSVDLTAYNDSTDRYDTHSYRLMVSSDGSFDAGSLVVDQTYECSAGDEPDTWQATLASDLIEGATYYWRVVYGDDGGLIHTPFNDQTEARTFTVNASTDAPAAPTQLNPSGGIDVTAQPVAMSFVNNGDPDSPVLDFAVALSTASGAAFDANIVRTIPIPDVDRNQTAVSVPVADLTENQRYYWRVSVSDADGNTATSAAAEFRLNADNDPPGTPVAIQPMDNAVWSSYAPTFIAQVQGDSEGDPVYCLFEVFAEEDGERVASSQRMAAGRSSEAPYIYTCAWRLDSTALSNNTTYRWVVTAYDGPGESAAYTAAAFHFTTGVNFYQPSAPTLNNPYSGGTVQELKPALSLFRSADDDGDNLSYQFELYPCPNLSCRTIPLAEPVGRVQTVEAVPVSALEEGQTYYWRARAMDRENPNEGHASAWMPTACFTVDSDGSSSAFDARIDLSRIALYNAAESQVFTVTASDAPDMVGVQVTIPVGAIPVTGGDINLQIGHATRSPALPIGKAAVGAVIFLAPEGFQFAEAVTVRIPVAASGSDDPEGLQVLTYDTDTREWTQVPASLADNGLTMETQVSHFSLYTLALDDPITPGGDDDPTGDGGGGGGCFIGSLAE
jgi:hypothetical protein